MMRKPNYKNALHPAIFKILREVCTREGIEAYVIGGFVRDYFLKRNQSKKDIDIVCIGSGIDLAEKVAQALTHKPKVQVFKTYGTAMLRYKDTDIEFVGARSESYSKDSRNPKVKSGSLQDDQNRRDFTINALALSLHSKDFGDLLDPFNGLEDLRKGIIKTPLNPEVTYSDDPLRMLRAIRFATQLNFQIEANSLKAIASQANRLEIITKERIVEELHKILASDKPSKGFLLLEKTGLLQQILPEITNLKGIDEVDGKSHKDNFYHTLEVVDNICPYTDNIWLRWAALLHDIGKAPTKRFHNKTGWTFHGHEYKGAKMVAKLFSRLKMPKNEKMKFVQKMVAMSSRPIVIASDVTDSAVRRLVFDAGNDLDDLMKLCKADITTKNPKRFQKYHNNFEIVTQKVIDVEKRDHIKNFQPPVSGKEIMKTFQISPCKEIGIIKETIKEAILEGVITNNYEPAFALMLQKGKELGLKTNTENHN